jgi:hypothetical protein
VVRERGEGSEGERTGASPKSFSGLLYDILTVFVW